MLLRLLVAASLLFTAGLTGCENTSEAPMEMGRDYYPLKVSDERVYNVELKTYRDNRVVTATSSQLRERVTETYRDAAGKLNYKVERAVRATANDAWRVDSVQALTVNERNLQLTRSNRRTVELLFPVRPGVEWNRNAFNNLDTVVAVNRQYVDVGQAFTAGGRTYENTVTTFDEGDDPSFVIYRNTNRQVFAKGVGPVYREWLRLNYCQNSNQCSVGTNYIQNGTERKETLVQ